MQSWQLVCHAGTLTHIDLKRMLLRLRYVLFLNAHGTLASVCWARREAYFSLMSNSSVRRPCAACCLLCCMRYACINTMVGCETAVACLVPLLVPVAQTDLLSAVTPLAGGAGGRGFVCLGPTLGFRPNMTARAMG